MAQMQSSPQDLAWKESARSTLKEIERKIARTEVYLEEVSDPQVVSQRLQEIHETTQQGVQRFQQYAGSTQQFQTGSR
jgi:hypothetical protein